MLAKASIQGGNWIPAFAGDDKSSVSLAYTATSALIASAGA